MMEPYNLEEMKENRRQQYRNMPWADWSDQYDCPAYKPRPQDTVEEVLEWCVEEGAVWDEDPDGREYCVILREDVGPELWTESALRRTWAQKEKKQSEES